MKYITEHLKKMIRDSIGYLSFFLLFICVLPTLQPLQSAASEQVEYKAWLSSGEKLSLQKNRFSLYEKVYIIVRFQELASGEHTINSDWLNPEGQLEQHNTNTFYLKKQSDYTYYAWLSLLKNGPMKRLLTGSDINRKFHGNWQIQLFLNGQKIDNLAFTMH